MQVGLDYIGVVCIFACHDGAGRLLLARRSDKARDEQGCWETGGGQVNFGERLDETIRREVLEEYGAEVLEIELLHAFSSLRTIDGQLTHWVGLIHMVRVDPAMVTIRELEKFTDLGWFDLDHLPSPLHSQIIPHALPSLRTYFARTLVPA